MDRVVQLRHIGDNDRDIYTNVHPLWHPPGAPGIFGGVAIAQCLSAAQATIPQDFSVHSMHCYFVLAGHSDLPIQYYVDRVRDGKTFATRSVQARQGKRCIFTATLSFIKEDSAAPLKLEYALRTPSEVEHPPGNVIFTAASDDEDRPSQSVRCPIIPGGSPSERKLRQWIRAVGRISDSSPVMGVDEYKPGPGMIVPRHKHEIHLAALAYLSDTFSIGTVARVNNLVRYSDRTKIEATLRDFRGSESEREKAKNYLEGIAREESEENKAADTPERNYRIGMMVSLNHTIFFHNPRAFSADDWMLSEVETPWAGAGRGLVMQRIWSREGVLIATCVQEGVVRLEHNASSRL